MQNRFGSWATGEACGRLGWCLLGVALCSFVLLHADPAAAAIGAGLQSITRRLDEVNTWLVSLGSVFAVTGFIWAILAFMGRVGGFSGAVTTLFAGLTVANAKEIVAFFTGAVVGAG